MGPQTRVGEYFHAMKYRADGESFRESNNRVAAALKDNDDHYHAFREITGDMRFLPGGRIQSAMGSARATTPYNCYVSGSIEDSFVHGDGNIMQRATEAASTMRMGGGIGYDFSRLRPRGALIRKLQSHSTGPVSFMSIFDAVCKCVASSGHRRGAQMGVLRVDHPDIEEFLHAKQNTDQLTGFNISIAITDEFMNAVKERRLFHLRWGGEVYKEVDAANLWEAIMRSTWDWAEPGVLFIDRINEQNNLRYCEEIAATNPCGEQPLPPFGACLLGSFNLAKYVKAWKTIRNVDELGWTFDYDQLKADIPYVVRAMDNVVDRARYPLPEQEAEAKNKRRMGLGVTGLANAGEALGHSYGSPEFLDWMETVLETIAVESYRASALLAKEKGAFPLCDERIGDAPFIKKLPQDVQDLIEDYGLRNSHLTSIAPTGTISLTADNISSGCEPVFSYVTQRPVNTPSGQELVEVEDYGLSVFGVRGKTADQVTAQEHIAVLTTAQKWVDSAVSKTCNMDGSMSWEDFKALYMTAWEGGAKGCTTFNIDGKRMALLTGKKTEDMDDRQGESCQIDPVTGRRECA